jgi:hypothetical protein
VVYGPCQNAALRLRGAMMTPTTLKLPRSTRVVDEGVDVKPWGQVIPVAMSLFGPLVG